MSQTQQNLARKWRSKNFNQIIGQEISVRMLKNSLYLNHFFPVYLFSGQRGCGKTTTARVFAAAINCEYLHDFQANPKEQQLPCQQCDSCKAFVGGKHPDFIEMDAASHTGVDNVRQIIEAASLMPLLGRKKVYLIDEAHMLSKAAFNAFLKILEEPPETVIFILATTDEHKIIDTVRSRCFQLFFNAIDEEVLVKHLASICAAEEIECTDDGLRLIIREAGGSARDAINILEQVRFAAATITPETVRTVLGSISDEQLCGIVEHLLTAADSPAGLLSYLESIQLEQFAPDIVWGRLGAMLQALMWMRNGCVVRTVQLSDSLVAQVHSLPVDRLVASFSFYCEQELMFVRASNKQLFLSMFLVRLWDVVQPGHSAQIAGASEMSRPAQPVKQPTPIPTKPTPAPATVAAAQHKQGEYKSPWEIFLARLHEKNDQLLLSLFAQAEVTQYDDSVITVKFDKKFQFFADTLEETRAIWQPWLREAYSKEFVLQPVFEGASAVAEQPDSDAAKKKRAQVTSSSDRSLAPRSGASVGSARPSAPAVRHAVDVSDKEAWKFANSVLEHFPGRITEIVEG